MDVVPEPAPTRRRVGGTGGDETSSSGGVGAHDAEDALPNAAEEEGEANTAEEDIGGGGGATRGGEETPEQWGSAVVLMLTQRREGVGGLLQVPLNNWECYMRKLEGREGIPPRKNVKKSLVKLGFTPYLQQGAWFVKTDDRGGQALQEYMSRSAS